MLFAKNSIVCRLFRNSVYLPLSVLFLYFNIKKIKDAYFPVFKLPTGKTFPTLEKQKRQHCSEVKQ